MILGTEAFGILGLGEYEQATLAATTAFLLADGLPYADTVTLLEISPTTGIVATPTYTDEAFGTFPFGTLPWSIPASGSVPVYLSDRDWTGRQTQAPALSSDFTTGVLPTGWSCIRASAAWRWNQNGKLEQVSTNTARLDYDMVSRAAKGLLTEADASTNQIRNATATGSTNGVVGSGGALPTNWAVHQSRGLTTTINASGTYRGMPYVEVRVSGSPSSTGQYIIRFDNTTQVSAVSTEKWTQSLHWLLKAGSTTNIGNGGCRITERDAAGAGLVGDQTDALSALASDWSRPAHSRTLNNASTAKLTGEFYLGVTSGQAVDITFWIGGPQLEKFNAASSIILSNGSATTRQAERCEYVLGSINMDSRGTIKLRCTPTGVVNAVSSLYVIASLSDGTTNNRHLLSRNSTPAANFNTTVGGVASASISVTPWASGEAILAYGYAVNDFGASFNGGVDGTDTSGTVPTGQAVLALGSGRSGAYNGGWNGWISTVDLWADRLSNSKVSELAGDSALPGWAQPVSQANIHYQGRIDAPEIERALPLGPNTLNQIAVGIASLTIQNRDGGFDTSPLDMGIDNQPVMVKLLRHRSHDYSQAITLFDGRGANWFSRRDALQITARDSGYELAQPLLTLFGGTGGADGNADNKGKVIPQVYGLCRNIAPVLVDPVKLIYRFHDRLAQAVDAVYVRGADVTFDASYASYATLDAATVAAGKYATALTASGSFIRLGSNPDGTVTADVRGDAANGYVSDTANVAKQILLRLLASSRLNLTSFTTLAADYPGVIGIYLTDQNTAEQALNAVLSAAGCFWGDVGDGLMSVGRLSPPDGMGGYEFNQYNSMAEFEPLQLPDSFAPCIYRRTIGYRRNWQPLAGTDIIPVGGTMTETRRKELQEEIRIATITDSTRLSKNPLAQSPDMLGSLFDTEADAQALATAQMSLYAPGRMLARLVVGLDGYALQLNDVIKVTWPRYGLQSGKPFRVVGMAAKGRRVTLTLFG